MLDYERKSLAEEDVPDEVRIKVTIAEFYDVANTIFEDNLEDIIDKLKARRNVIITMMRVYLANFENDPIIDDFEEKLKKAKESAEHRYLQYLNEIKVVGIFLGIKENLTDKMADQFYKKMKGK